MPTFRLAILCAMLTAACATAPARSPSPESRSPSHESSVPSALYPPIEPYRTGYFPASANHELYFEESGNPQGLPVVFLHGGPGSGTKPAQRRFFDPARYHIVLFDQAGAGKSRARKLLAENDTWSLVEQLDRLRASLKIDKWLLFGGSWGSTLALAYAERHPARVTGIITWGVFLSRPAELDWTYKAGGASSVRPEAFERFASFVAPRERADLVAAYIRRFHSPDQAVRREAVRRWSEYEDTLAQIEPPSEMPQEPTMTDEELDGTAYRRALIESHYMAHGSFLSKTHNELLAHADHLRGIPITIIAGRYDLVCPLTTAYDLKRAAPWAELKILPLSGHGSLSHPEVTAALVAAARRFADSHRE